MEKVAPHQAVTSSTIVPQMMLYRHYPRLCSELATVRHQGNKQCQLSLGAVAMKLPCKCTVKGAKVRIQPNNRREPHGAIEYAFKMVLTNSCYQIASSYRKVRWYPHTLKTVGTVIMENVPVPSALKNCWYRDY